MNEHQANQIIIISGALINDGKVLLVRRKEGQHQGQYELPGGKVEFTETPERTLVREYQEETGLLIDPFVPISTSSRVSEDGQTQYIRINYLVEYADDSHDIFLSPEHDEHLWADLQQVDELFSQMEESVFLAAKLALEISANAGNDYDPDSDTSIN